MADWRYEARDLRTGTLLGDLPLSGVQWSQALEQQGLRGILTGRINLQQRSAAARESDPFVLAAGGGGYTLTTPAILTESSTGGYREA